MSDYEILAYIANAKDDKGNPISKPSHDIKGFDVLDEKENTINVKIACSCYRTVKDKQSGETERIEVRAADHGTTIRNYFSLLWKDPQRNRQNLDLVFSNSGKANSDLKSDKFLVVEQYTYTNSNITNNDLDLIIDAILKIPIEDFEDPTGKALYEVIAPTDFDGKSLPVPTGGIHPKQLAQLERYKQQQKADAEKDNDIKESKYMKKNRIKLTESQLNRVIKESVKNVLSEEDEQERYRRIWKEHRYMSISLKRALYLLDRLSFQIQHTP